MKMKLLISCLLIVFMVGFSPPEVQGVDVDNRIVCQELNVQDNVVFTQDCYVNDFGCLHSTFIIQSTTVTITQDYSFALVDDVDWQPDNKHDKNYKTNYKTNCIFGNRRPFVFRISHINRLTHSKSQS